MGRFESERSLTECVVSQSADAFRLQGVQRLRWRKRKLCIYLSAGWTQFWNGFRPWGSSLRAVEGRCGAGVAELFVFVKMLIALNAFAAVAVFAALIAPSVYLAESRGRARATEQLWTECETSNGSASVECCSAIYANGTRAAAGDGPRLSVRGVLDAIRGAGWLDGTPMYYGYYPNGSLGVGRLFRYHVPLAYAATAIGYFALFLAVIVRRSTTGFRQRVVEAQVRCYAYANSVFVGWDYCISDRASAALKQTAIYDELRSLVAGPRHGRAAGNVLAVRLLVGSLVVALIGSACFTVHLVFRHSVRSLQREQPTPARALWLEYAAPAAVTFYNVALPVVFDALVRFERRSAHRERRLRALRVACVKLALLAALLGSVYALIECCARDNGQCSGGGAPLCWETYAGKVMYRLLAADVAVGVCVAVLIGRPSSALARRVDNRLLRAACKRQPHLAKHVLDVVYVQAVVWLGSFYVTPMPALGLVALVVVFYTKRFACVAADRGLARQVHSPSRTRTAVMSALLVAYLLCTAAWLAAASTIVPSRSCGPFKGLPSAWTALAEATSRAVPVWVVAGYQALATVNVVCPLLFGLLCVVYYYRVAVSSNRKMVTVLRKQLVLEGHDKQFLLNRLSAFIKQQDRRRKVAAAATADNAGADALLC